MNDLLTRVHASRSADVKAGLDHPVIDTDVHVNDYAPVLEDYVAQYGGNKLVDALRKALSDAGHNTNVGDEGGFAPNLATADEALAFIMKSIEKAGYRPGEDVMLALDPASTEFFKKGKYELEGEKKSLDAGGMVDFYADLRALTETPHSTSP